jgi:hypothetical protein
MSSPAPSFSLNVPKPAFAQRAASAATSSGRPLTSVALQRTAACSASVSRRFSSRSSKAVEWAQRAGSERPSGAAANGSSASSSRTTVRIVTPPRRLSGTASPSPSTPSSSLIRSSTISRRVNRPRAVTYGSLNGSA